MPRVTVQLIHQTDAAILLEKDGIQEWIPDYQATLISNNSDGTRTYYVSSYHFNTHMKIEVDRNNTTNDNYTSFEAVLVRETEAAWGVKKIKERRFLFGSKGSIDFWLPKSQCDADYVTEESYERIYTFKVPRWLAREKSLN